MMAHWVCELFTFEPAFLYVVACLEGKTLTEKKEKKGKKRLHKNPGEVRQNCNEKKE